jgi:hypothetical protein
VNLFRCVGFVDHIDADALSNSGAQHGARELTVVGSGYKSVTRRYFNLTLADAQHMNIRIRSAGQRAEATAGRREPRQLQKGPASEQAG